MTSWLRWRRATGSEPTLRRRLLVYSAPIALLLVLAIVKAVSVVVAGEAAQSDFAAKDAGAMRGDVAILEVVNVVEPANAHFAAGALAVLENRLDDADRNFSESLARADPATACLARVNLEFVRETLGDRAAATFQTPTALSKYVAALDIVTGAQPTCFAGNTDADPARQALRADAAIRLGDKIRALQGAVPPPPPPPVGGSPPPESLPAGADPDSRTGLRLNPGAGDPLDRLQQILRDAAAAQGSA